LELLIGSFTELSCLHFGQLRQVDLSNVQKPKVNEECTVLTTILARSHQKQIKLIEKCIALSKMFICTVDTQNIGNIALAVAHFHRK